MSNSNLPVPGPGAPPEITIYSKTTLNICFLRMKIAFTKSVKDYIKNPDTHTPIIMLNRQLFQSEWVGIHNTNHPQNPLWHEFCKKELSSVTIKGKDIPITGIREIPIYDHNEFEESQRSPSNYITLADGRILCRNGYDFRSWHSVPHEDGLQSSTAMGLAYQINIFRSLSSRDVLLFENHLKYIESELFERDTSIHKTLCHPLKRIKAFEKYGNVILSGVDHVFFQTPAWKQFQSNLYRGLELLASIQYGYLPQNSTDFKFAVVGDKNVNLPFQHNPFGYYLITAPFPSSK
jgi:hypothetical protein